VPPARRIVINATSSTMSSNHLKILLVSENCYADLQRIFSFCGKRLKSTAPKYRAKGRVITPGVSLTSGEMKLIGQAFFPNLSWIKFASMFDLEIEGDAFHIGPGGVITSKQTEY
jgi:hypothetical protein